MRGAETTETPESTKKMPDAELDGSICAAAQVIYV